MEPSRHMTQFWSARASFSLDSLPFYPSIQAIPPARPSVPGLPNIQKKTMSESIESLESSTEASDDGYSSDEELRLAQLEWEENLQQLQLLISVVLMPYIGKWLGRKWAHTSMCSIHTLPPAMHLNLLFASLSSQYTRDIHVWASQRHSSLGKGFLRVTNN